MSKCKKIWLITAASLVLLGGILYVGVMTMLGWNFKNLSTVKYETNAYEISEAYQSISVVTDTADVIILPSEDGVTTVTCYEEQRIKHAVSVQDGTLVIDQTDTRKWYHYIGVSLESTKITVRIPAGEYEALSVKIITGDVDLSRGITFGNVDIKGNTGDVECRSDVTSLLSVKVGTGSIEVAGISAGAMNLTASTGDIDLESVTCAGDINLKVGSGDVELEDVTCVNLTGKTNTGDVEFSRVLTAGTVTLDTDTGSVEFERCDAAELRIATNTGSVRGTLLSEKIFVAKSDTGSIRVPETLKGGKCKITTNTGSIRISIVN